MSATIDFAYAGTTFNGIVSFTYSHSGTASASAVSGNIYYFDPTKPPSTFTYGGTAMPEKGGINVPSGTAERAALHGLTNLAALSLTGAQNVRVEFPAAAFGVLSTLTAQGVDTTTVFRNTPDTANGTGTAISVVCNSATDDLVTDVVGSDAAVSLTLAGSGTQFFNTSVGTIFAAGSTDAGAATVTRSWTRGLSGPWAAVTGSFKAAAGGGGGPASILRNSQLNGLGGGGPFFGNPLGYVMVLIRSVMRGFARAKN